MNHCLDLLPLGPDGTVRNCWLDRPISAVVLACTCGWHGEVLDLSEDDLNLFYGEPLTEEQFTALYESWEAIHAAALVPAVADLREPALVLADLILDGDAAGVAEAAIPNDTSHRSSSCVAGR